MFNKYSKEDKDAIETEVAQRHAKRLIGDALDKSASIIKETELFRGRAEEEFNAVLKNKISEISQKSDKFMERADKFYEELADKSAGRIEERVKLSLEQLTEAFGKQLIIMQRDAAKEQADAKEELKNNIEKAEKEYFSSLKKNISARLPEIVAKVAGRSIDLKDHEDLLMSALQEAKNDGVWDAK